MSKRFYIKIAEDNLDFIAAINNGVTPMLEQEPTYFLFEIAEDGGFGNTDIISRTDFYQNYTSYTYTLVGYVEPKI